MSIAKQTKDIYGKKIEKGIKKGFNGEKITEIILIICIIISSVNLTYWLVPTFLSIAFVLIQLRKISNKISKR